MANNITYVYSNNNVLLSEGEYGILNGEPVKKYTWTTKSGFSVTVISYGAIIQAIKVPDQNGDIADVVLGFDDLTSYVTQNTPDLLGAAVGRCAARIAGATFHLDGVDYQLTNNCGRHHLHGGTAGFDKVNWKSIIEGNKVVFSHLSRDGDQGYPGNLIASVSYEVKPDDTFHVEYSAIADRRTVVNLTNHSYFNLAGHSSGADALSNHVVTINSDRILEADRDWVPTGGFAKVGGTHFDLRAPTRLGQVLSNDSENLRFHHCFCISRHGNKGLNFVSRVEHPQSGRYVEVYSDQPGLIFYTGNYIGSPDHPQLVGKGGAKYGRCSGLCLETMNLVDAIHHSSFPSPVLSPGDIYKHRVSYSFGTVKQ